jgi:hypothetical protein
MSEEAEACFVLTVPLREAAVHSASRNARSAEAEISSSKLLPY